MGKKVITMSLSEKSIQNAIQELRAYQNSLTYKCQLLAEKLAEKGVEIARVQIADLDAIFTSELISSVHVEYEGSTKGGGIWAVIAGTDHAAFVEFGTGTVGQQILIQGNCRMAFRGSMQVEKLSIRFQMEDMDGFIRTTMAIGGLQRECQADHSCI